MRARRFLPTLLALLSLSIASAAEAQVDFAVHVEGGGVTMLSPHQREVLGYDSGGTATLRPSLRLANMFAVELGAGAFWFPSSNGVGSLFVAGGGLRFEPMIGDAGRLFVDAHASYGLSVDLSRLVIDVGLGFQIRAVNEVGIGPFVRYTHALASGPTDGGDAMMIQYGLSAYAGTVSTAPGDLDADGITDDRDLCVDVPQGDAPDPERLGCPLPDTDGDGVHDRDDLCPRVHHGEEHDEQRLGCPLPDTDGDGTNDRHDLCPTVPAGERPDAQRLGCPMHDTDLDTIVDPEDPCPTTPPGEHPDPQRPGCPDGDDDGDGVLNATDQCRTEHQAFHPDPARPGCPLPDGDHDNVPDAEDACPTEPGAPSRDRRRHGCPGLVRVETGRIVIERPVYFASGRDTILRRSQPVLNALLEALLATPEIRRVSIEGHTDDVGEEAQNLDLSTRRAESVVRWLVEHGVEASRLEAHGFGETRPVVQETTRQAREQNRRVEFRVVDPAPPQAAVITEVAR